MITDNQQWKEDLDTGFQRLHPRSHEEHQSVAHGVQHEAYDMLRHSHVDRVLPRA